MKVFILKQHPKYKRRQRTRYKYGNMVLFVFFKFICLTFYLEILTRSRGKKCKEYQHEYVTYILIIDTLKVF